jgi:hypothetical protein
MVGNGELLQNGAYYESLEFNLKSIAIGAVTQPLMDTGLGP